MISIKLGKRPDLRVKAPGRAFYKAVGVEARKQIRVRTETQGVDHEGDAFAPYSPGYLAKRIKSKRSGKPNLSFTGQMLGSIQVQTSRKGVSLVISGQQGLKAWGNELHGRPFFFLSEKEKATILADIARWVTKKNRLHG